MAQFDLKNATIVIKDGYGAVGAVAGTGPYAIGVNTFTVSGFTIALADDDTFTLAGDPTIYKITSHTETANATTSITFSPALVAQATTSQVITVLPHQLEIVVGEGNVEWTEHRAMKYTLNKGKLYNARLDDEQPMDVSFDIIWEWLTTHDNTTPPTVEDVLKRRKGAAAWVSSGADPCEPYAVDIEITVKPPCPDGEYETYTLPEFRYEELDHSTKDGTVSCKGKCKATQALMAHDTAA